MATVTTTLKGFCKEDVHLGPNEPVPFYDFSVFVGAVACSAGEALAVAMFMAVNSKVISNMMPANYGEE